MSIVEKISGIVRYLNLQLEKQKNLSDFTFARDTYTDETGSREMVVIKPRSLSMMAKPENSIGLFLNDPVTGEDVRGQGQTMSEGEYIAKGMSFALQAYGFDQHLERFKRMAEKLNFVMSRYDIDDREKIAEFFFDNPKSLYFAADVLYRSREIIGDRTRISMQLVPVYGQPGKEVLTFDFLQTVDAVGIEPVERFYQQWWNAEGTKVPADTIIVFQQINHRTA